MNSNNVITMAKKIRNHDPLGYIIFMGNEISNSSLLLHSHIEILDFVTTDDLGNLPLKIKSCIDYITKQNTSYNHKKQHIFLLKQPGRTISIEYSTIFYIKSVENSHNIMMSTNDGVKYYTYTLSDIFKLLDSRFTYCHRNCIVSLDYIQEINTTSRKIFLKNEESLIISKRRLHTFLVQFADYVENNFKR